MKRAAIYARASCNEPIQFQLNKLREVAQRRGIEVVVEYKDIVSGTSAKRHGLEALMADSKHGRFSVVLTNSLACLSKGTKHLLQLAEHFGTLHIDLISAQEAIDTSTATGKLFFDAMANLKQCEAELVKEHIRQGLRRRKLDGFRLGRAPLDIDHDALVHDRLSGMSLTNVGKKYNVSKASVVRFVRLAQKADAMPCKLSLAAQREAPAAA